MADAWSLVSIKERKDWAPGLMSIQLDAQLEFVPGQFANLALDIEGTRVRRSYSLASTPGAAPEFLITEVVRGEFTPHLFQQKEGQQLWMQTTAAGLFTLEHIPAFARELWLLSTGTGVAPYLSMLNSGELFPRFERVAIVHGVRVNAHLAYRDQFLAAQRDNPALSYVPLVTREEPSQGVLAGRLTAALESGELEKAAGFELNQERSHIMLCGNPEMVKEGRALLGQRGLLRHRRREPGHVTVEKYW